MGMYRVEWDCCGSVTETDGYLPSRCPICECDALRRERDLARDELSTQVHIITSERDELAAKYDGLLVALHGIGRALGIDEADRSPYSITCGVLVMATRLAEIERQEPVAWVLRSTVGRSAPWVVTSKSYLSCAKGDEVDQGIDHLDPLYTRPAPAKRVSAADELAQAAAPDHCEDAREMVCATSVPDGEIRAALAELDALRSERDELSARLAEIERAEPVAWVPMHPRNGALWAMTTATPSEERLPSHYPLSPLYARPSPAAVPAFRAADPRRAST